MSNFYNSSNERDLLVAIRGIPRISGTPRFLATRTRFFPRTEFYFVESWISYRRDARMHEFRRKRTKFNVVANLKLSSGRECEQWIFSWREPDVKNNGVKLFSRTYRLLVRPNTYISYSRISQNTSHIVGGQFHVCSRSIRLKRIIILLLTSWLKFKLFKFKLL